MAVPSHRTGPVDGPVGIADPGDPRLADYVRLTDVHLRRSLEAAHGLFIAEGEKVISRAVSAGYPVRSVLVGQDKLTTIADLAARIDAPLYVLPAEVAAQLTGYRVHRGALASMQRLPLPPLSAILNGASRIVVLEDIVDHANVGSIFRCAAGLGFDAAVLAPRCADPLYRRAVKVSMGAVFALSYTRLADWRDGLTRLRAEGFRLVALTPAAMATPIDRIDKPERLALLVGGEGEGLSARWLSQADELARIPMHAGLDSLNVAAAAAIACYLLARRA